MRTLAWGLSGLFLALILVMSGAYLTFRASLPQVDGQVPTPGLTAPATIERDALGVPTIRAGNRSDLAFATGYVHAQERFFQMDLQRRLAAGELAELLGAQALPTDRTLRRHQFAGVAEQVFAQSSSAEQRLLEAYAAGVNQALSNLGARPWEYFLLGSPPKLWQPRDSLLVAFAMYLDLNDTSGERELANAALAANLPAELLPLLYPLGSEWDAPVDGGTWRLPPLPGPAIFDLRQGEPRRQALSSQPTTRLTENLGDAALGSNSWAVAGSHTLDGRALLANDMHLGLQVPNIWYRAQLVVTGAGQEPVDVIGVTLPGLPVVIAGSNRHVAWGFTNTHGDWTDLVTVTVDPADSGRYLTAEGPRRFETHDEIINVRGEMPETVTITRTIWGPVVARDVAGLPLALAWTAHRPEATNLRMLGLETTRTVSDALQIANESGAPVQNFIAADEAGNIGWTLFGQIPVREGYDSRFPAAWKVGTTGWIRWRTPAEYPRIINPLGGRLWTANARTITASTWLEFVGPGSYVLGARAGQIRDGLLNLKSATAADMLAIQLDDRALFLARWRDLLLQILDDAAVGNHADRQEVRRLVETWSGRAAVDDAGYLMVRTFRRAVLTSTYGALVAPARTAHPHLSFEPGQQFEGSAWQLVTERPPHLLDPHFGDWDEALLAWLDLTITELKSQCDELASCSWGRDNSLVMRHPLSRALPWAAWLIDMPSKPLPGDSNMPRVQGRRQGASERIVVSPGRESEGFFQMPGGQSSHPLSPWFRSDHEAWVTGQPQPLLPGNTRHVLTLLPDPTTSN